MEQIYTVQEVAKILRVGKNKVYDIIHAGLLPYLKIGGIKVRESELEEFVKKYSGYDLTDTRNILKI